MKTAFLIIIGDEILSGKTKDKNINFLAIELNNIGIQLAEVRIIPDIEQNIIDTIIFAKSNYDYVFTSGGLGPTHDDITAEAVAKATGNKLILHPEAHSILQKFYDERGDKLNSARLKMAYIPENADIIHNDISAAPGFHLENIFVFAGVPSILQNMYIKISPLLDKGNKIIQVTIHGNKREGDYATDLGLIAKQYRSLSIGSYVHMQDGSLKTSIVIRGTDQHKIDCAEENIKIMLNKY